MLKFLKIILVFLFLLSVSQTKYGTAFEISLEKSILNIFLQHNNKLSIAFFKNSSMFIFQKWGKKCTYEFYFCLFCVVVFISSKYEYSVYRDYKTMKYKFSKNNFNFM